MNFPDAVKSAFQNYGNFQDRASRSEFWYWILFYLSARLCAAAFDLYVIGVNPGEVISGPAEALVGLALLVPLISVSVRRVHDVDHSGWWVATIVMAIYWAFIKGDESINRFGPPNPQSPKRGMA